jgi:ribonuclease HI
MGYTEYGEEIRRLFDPYEVPNQRSIPRSELVVYNPKKKVSQLKLKVYSQPEPIIDEQTLIFHIDGACRNNGSPDATSSFGVYFGPNSPYNTHGLIAPSIPQTSTRAEIEALSHALDVICDITDNDMILSQIKIATDSSFLVDAMSQHIED